MSYVCSLPYSSPRSHIGLQEPLPGPTPAELAVEAQQEAAVFAQAANVDRLLTMLRSVDPAKDNLADNEEIQELYRSCMTLRPKIVKLIDKYSQKRGV
jgi:signal transducing adaptor molecule